MSQSCLPKDLVAQATCLECLSVPQLEAIQAYLLCQIANNGGGGGSTAKVYRALLTQAGGAAPVATVLENTLGATPVWSRSGQGDYLLTLANGFPTAKTLYFATINWNPPVGSFSLLKFSPAALPNVVELTVGDDSGSQDDVLNNTPFEIYVYP